MVTDVILSYCESHVFYVRRMRAWLIRERYVVSLNLLLVPASVFSSCVSVRKLVFSFLQVCTPTGLATDSPITQTSSYMRIKKKEKKSEALLWGSKGESEVAMIVTVAKGH